VRLAHQDLGLPQWPLWHCSVAYHSPLTGRPVSRLLWVPETTRRVRRIARETLRGVGDHALAHWEPGGVALHLRVPMTVTEALGLKDIILARCPTRRAS
jgi:hypothetical protein